VCCVVEVLGLKALGAGASRRRAEQAAAQLLLDQLALAPAARPA